MARLARHEIPVATGSAEFFFRARKSFVCRFVNPVGPTWAGRAAVGGGGSPPRANHASRTVPPQEFVAYARVHD